MPEFNEQKFENFTHKLTATLNAGALNLGLGLGYRLGLFRTLAEFDSPRPARAVAGAAGLSPRYVREWLGLMTAGGVVEITTGPDGEALYYLPPEHAAPLIGAHGRSDLGVYTQEIPLLTTPWPWRPWRRDSGPAAACPIPTIPGFRPL